MTNKSRRRKSQPNPIYEIENKIQKKIILNLVKNSALEDRLKTKSVKSFNSKVEAKENPIFKSRNHSN